MDPHGILTEENKEILVSNHGFNIFDLELKLAIVNSSETKKLLLRITVTFWHLLATSCGPRPTAWPVDSSWWASSATIGWPKWGPKRGKHTAGLRWYSQKKYLCCHWFGMQHFHLRPHGYHKTTQKLCRTFVGPWLCRRVWNGILKPKPSNVMVVTWGVPCQTLTPYQWFKIYKGFLPYAGPWLRSRVFDGIPQKVFISSLIWNATFTP